MVSSRRVLPSACRALPVLIAAVGTLEYVAIDLPHRGRSLAFLYLASAVLLWNQRHPVASPLTALGVVVAFAVVDPIAVTTGNTTLLLGMFCMFVIAAFNPGRVAGVGGVVGLACLAVVALREPELDASGLVVLGLLLLVAWGAGRLSALRDRIAGDMRDQAERAVKERAEASERAVELERARIARELHDVVAHHISVIVVQARGGRRCLTSAPEDAREAFDAIETLGGEALTEMRQMVGVLSQDADTPLEPAPSLRRMSALLGQVRSTGQEVDLVVQGTPVALPPGLDLAAYRIVQEALTNVVKHTRRAHARVTVSYRPADLQLQISDDEPGTHERRAIDDHAPRGLLGMRERVALYGGTLSTDHILGQGFTVNASFPLPTEVR
jgi:signal transduction histidine kinase